MSHNPDSPANREGENSSHDSSGKAGRDTSGHNDDASWTRLQSIFDREDCPRTEKITAALRLGRDRLEATNAYLAHVDPAEGLHTITETVGDHPKLTAGTETPLAQTYCRETIARSSSLAILNAPDEGWAGDPAQERYGFSTHLSAKVRVDDALYGTVCFADEAPRNDLSAADTEFLERLAAAIGHELSSPVPSLAPEDLLTRIQEVAEVGAWVYDAETDTVTGTDELYRLLELPEGQAFDLETGLDFYVSEGHEKVQSAVQQCLEQGVPFDLTVPLNTAQQTRRWVRVRGSRHHRADGTTQLTGTLQDVTERKRIEETLEKERSVLRRMYRITADREASFDAKIRRLIDLGREYLGLPYGFLTHIEDGTQRIVEAQGSHPLLQPGESCPLSESYCRKTIEEENLLAVQDALSAGWTGDPAFQKFGLGSYIGAKVLVENELYGTFCFAAHEARAPAFNNPERTFVELLTRWASYELEQQQATERLERQNERLDRLAGVVSHDLRNPLNVAQGRLQLAREQLSPEALADDTTEHLDAVDRAHDRIDMIIENMLALTQSCQGLADEEFTSLPFREIVESSWSQVNTKNATLQLKWEGSLQANEGRLRQLFENLFRNAIEHGGDSVTVSVGRLPNGFYVEDDGDGLPDEAREKVFEANYSTSEEGTGLGLSIAKTVAEAHGWTINATNGTHGGARFEFTGVD